MGYSPWGRKRVKTPLSTARQQEITLVGPDKPIQEKELLFPHFQPNLYILTNKESRCEDISLSRAAERLVAGTVYSVVSDSFTTPWTVGLCPWDFPGKSTGVGCHYLLQPRE